MNMKTERGPYGSYLPIYVMHRHMHKNGSLGQSFQVYVSVTCHCKNQVNYGSINKGHETGRNNKTNRIYGNKTDLASGY